MSQSNPHIDPNADDRGIGNPSAPACGAGDLKGLLDTIVDQLTDADRRHSETLNQMQDRLAGIGRDAQTLRERMPEQFSTTFDRIEAGMSELSTRIAEAGLARPAELVPAVASTETSRDPMPYWVESATAPKHAPEQSIASPVALRSAVDPSATNGRARETDTQRIPAGVDPFDVIESSVPGSVTDPWDGDSAEALAGLYESGAASYAVPAAKPDRAPLPPMETMMSDNEHQGSAARSLDPAWLDARFAEIAARIEQSIADVRPDHGFFALGQRFDVFEQNIQRLVDNAATHQDIDSIRQIEGHISDVVRYLEHTQDQLLRLNAVEEQLDAIARRLDEVHGIALRSESGEPSQSGFHAPAPDFDVEQVVRAAAQETAQLFAELHQPHTGTGATNGGELKPMLERIMSENRQSDENTAALLDTLQQAMIRLLDRVDAMELHRHASHDAPHSPFTTPHGQTRPADLDAAIFMAANHDPAPLAPEIPQQREAIRHGAPIRPGVPVMPVARFEHDEPADEAERLPAETHDALQADVPRAAGKGRADLVAEARRARMRLAGASDDAALNAAIVQPTAAPENTKEVGRKPVAAANGKSSKTKSAGPSAPSSRLVLLAVLTLLSLAGLWYAFEDTQQIRIPAAAVGTEVAPANADGHAQASGEAHPASSPETPSQPDSVPGPRGDLQLKQNPEFAPLPHNLTVGSTSVPLHGVAIETNPALTMEEYEKKRRQQMMANISSQLGATAANSNATVITPVALTPDATPTPATPVPGTSDVQKSSLTRSEPLDMPSATVGPLSLRLAAANGDPSAEFEVGARLAEGKGTPQSFAEAAKWYQKSAAHGFPQAQYRLGTLYERGLGLKADPTRAEAWYLRAAEQGNIKAMHNLAVMAANQTKGSPDYTKASKWFREAAERGLADSQFNLAVLNENGLGLQQDLRQAFVWLSLAARGGDADAVRRRDILRGKLTVTELAEAETMLKAWKPKPVNASANDSRSAGEAWKKKAG